jgi:hypothetical protein
MTHYPTKPGFYYRNGRWYPSKKTKQKRAREKLIKEISEQIHLFPEKYPYEKFVLSQAAAKQLGFEVWWQKCKKGHLVERRVTESGCPVCARISRDIRDKRIAEGLTQLSQQEEIRLHEKYREAQRLTKTTGVVHHVDHIRPLAAGGVHHPDNLQVITAEENLSKSSFYKGKKAKFTKSEKKEAHFEFLREKEVAEKEARLKLEKERAAAYAEKKRAYAEKKRQENRTTLVIFGIIAVVVIFFMLA